MDVIDSCIKINTCMYIYIYCILRGQIKGFNSSITTILFEVGSYRTVVGYSYRILE